MPPVKLQYYMDFLLWPRIARFPSIRFRFMASPLRGATDLISALTSVPGNNASAAPSGSMNRSSTRIPGSNTVHMTTGEVPGKAGLLGQIMPNRSKYWILGSCIAFRRPVSTDSGLPTVAFRPPWECFLLLPYSYSGTCGQILLEQNRWTDDAVRTGFTARHNYRIHPGS